MKRLICITLALLLTLPLLTGCAGEKKSDGGIKIVCTVFPQYDWIRNILGDSEEIELTLIIQNGADPHSYQPTATDVMNISSCDMIVTLGGDSEKWVDEALERAQNADVKKIELAEIEGMTLREISSSSHTHEEDGHEHEHDHDHGAFDEHLWLSVKNAITATKALTAEICKLDANNSDTYQSNATGYISSLETLDEEYASVASNVPEENRFVLFADRFPFVYLLSDYDIEYQAAFEGCTTDTDADFDTVIKLINEADKHSVSYIAVTESSDGALAETVASSTKKKDIQILTLNSLQRVNKKDINNGVSYLGVMRENLQTLKTALGA